MLTVQLQTNIDNKWNACWPMNTLKPLAILDLISYLFFLKRLDEENLVNEKWLKSLRENFTDLKEVEYVKWSNFKDMEAQSVFELFTKENGLIELIKKYGNTDFRYSIFLKGSLFLTPTAILLHNCISIIKIFDTEAETIQSKIFEYILNKAELTGQNGQIYLPENIADLMISLLQPKRGELIWDPSAGNGNLLIKSAEYITNNNFTSFQKIKNVPDSSLFCGIESDLINLRIAAMNMILHGFTDPKLETVNTINEIKLRETEQPALIVSNLIFSAVEEKMTVEDNVLKSGPMKKEIIFLDIISKSLVADSRAVVIIPEVIFYKNKTEIKSIKQQIIDNCKPQAVISLPGNMDSLFSGAIILVFSGAGLVTNDKVWFYKMRPGQTHQYIENDEATKTENFPGNDNRIEEIVRQWENRNNLSEKNIKGESFYVTVDTLKNNNYNLIFNEYKMLLEKQELIAPAEKISVAKKIIPATKKISARKKNPAKKAVLITLVPILLAAIGYAAFYYLKLNNNVSVANLAGLPNDSAVMQGAKSSDSLSVKKNYIPDEKTNMIKQYMVLGRAYFYTNPDENTKRNSYINHSNTIILTPTDEKNGFVYIIYTNRHGQVTKGWLSKKDLVAVK